MHFFLAERPKRALRSGFYVIFVIGFFLSADRASAAENVRHTLSYPKDKQQLILVRSEFPVDAGVTELIMPNWTPGSYVIRDYAVNVDRLTVTREDGTALPVQKISKDRWHVHADRAGILIANYDVSTPDFHVSASWVSEAFSLFNGASIFLYTQQSRDLPQLVKVVANSDRGPTFTALPLSEDNTTYQAADYDELVDSPLVVANAPSYPFVHEGQDYVLLNVGENEFWDGPKAARDVEKIVVETQSFWRTNPLSKPYWFLNLAIEGKGGLEHDHSTVIMTGRRQMGDRDKYIQWLGVVAHEFFHVWNVRHMRPDELATYDYQNEQYTNQLWLAEGLTSYYDNLLMSRAQLITPIEYMALLARDIYRLETTPGRLLRPVTEASVDAWIRHYRPNADSINKTISYYTKGAVIGFVLDAHLRKSSRGRHDLDEVMRKMYSLYSNKPYSSDAFSKVLIDVGGAEAGRILQSLLTTTTDPDVDSALEWYGLELIRGPVVENGEVLESGLGVIWDEKKQGMVVKTVLASSGAAVAGLMAGDEVLAIGGERLTQKTLLGLMVSYDPGDNTTLLISRRGKVSSLDIKLDTAIPDHFAIALRTGFGKRHINRLQSLLGQKLRGRP